MASEPTLAFYIDAPLQSWGVSSRFQRRNTELFPTKSAIIGIIAAAIGIDKQNPDEPSRLAQLTQLRFTVYSTQPSGQLRQTLRLVDYQTIGGGWLEEWQRDKGKLRTKLSIPCKAGDGSPFGTVVTHRTYLTEARYIALLQGPSDTLTAIKDALQNPRWGIWFGRKCCIPASPLLPTLAPSAEAALHTLLEHINKIYALEIGHGQTQPPPETLDGIWFQNDQPVSFAKRQYLSRPVKRANHTSPI